MKLQHQNPTEFLGIEYSTDLIYPINKNNDIHEEMKNIALTTISQKYPENEELRMDP